MSCHSQFPFGTFRFLFPLCGLSLVVLLFVVPFNCCCILWFAALYHYIVVLVGESKIGKSRARKSMQILLSLMGNTPGHNKDVSVCIITVYVVVSVSFSLIIAHYIIILIFIFYFKPHFYFICFTKLDIYQ